MSRQPPVLFEKKGSKLIISDKKNQMVQQSKPKRRGGMPAGRRSIQSGSRLYLWDGHFVATSPEVRRVSDLSEQENGGRLGGTHYQFLLSTRPTVKKRHCKSGQQCENNGPYKQCPSSHMPSCHLLYYTGDCANWCGAMMC